MSARWLYGSSDRTPTPFWGRSLTRLEPTGRLRLPSGLFQAWAAVYPSPEAFLTILRPHELSLFPLPFWQGIERQLQEVPDEIRQKQDFLFAAYYYGTERRLDGYGRLYLRPDQRRALACSVPLLVVGKGTHIRLVCPAADPPQR